MSRPADEEMIGRNIAGKFMVEKFLGGGAMGAVYKAYQKSIQKNVAIKVLHKEFVVEPTFVSRFEREAKAASLLDHVNLMRVLDYGREPDGVCYIAMELLDGRSLYQLLKDDGRLTNIRIAGIIRQTLAGLAVAHEMGIIHRDLKPENIVVLEKSDDDGNRVELVKVCDFGMAKLVTPDHEAQGPLSSEKLTSHGVVVGTPDYMSPEQGKGERLDARSDLYAVGVILYQMLTGRLPFSAETPIATLLRHVIDEPEAPSDIDPTVHSGLESICLRALAKRRDDRFQTAREMRAEIRSVMEARGVSLPSALPPARRELGSFTEANFAAFDLRAPGVPRSMDAASLRGPLLTPPQSSRLRAADVLKEDAPRRSRTWLVPAIIAGVLGVGAGGYVLTRHRHVKAPEASATAAPPVEAPRAPSPTADNAVVPAPPTTGAPATPDPSRPAAPETKTADVPTYTAHTTGTVAIRGVGRPEPATSAAAPVSPVAPVASFGILAVPETPRIEGAPAPPAAATPAAAPPAPAAPAPADPFGHARVAVGAVHAEKVASADVLGALPSGRFDGCYKKALSARGSPVGGSGSLHVDIGSTGHIGGASFAGPADLAAAGQCIADAAIGRDVKHVEAGATGADVDLTFQPE